mgnify:FL=1
MAEVLFLGTGNAFAPPGRMHALALLDGNILIDAPPTALPQLRRAGVTPTDLKHLLFTHWHADHTFGFPFLILDRDKMGPIDGKRGALQVHCRPGGKDVLLDLCQTGFPGSLDEELSERVLWDYEESGNLEGTEWRFERFPVRHTPGTDPHGYRLVHNSGLGILHCGDSGPCKAIEERAPDSQIVILEMGVPDFVSSPHHHNPSDVLAFSERHPEVQVLVTHNFSRAPGLEQGFEIAELPSNIIQLNDGDSISVYDDGGFSVNN